MKGLLLFFLLFILVNCFAQNRSSAIHNLNASISGSLTDEWEILYPQPTNDILDGLEVKGDTIIVSGYEELNHKNTVLVVSSDKGNNWNVYKPESSLLFNKFNFTGNTLYGKGERFDGLYFYGMICKSTDLGKSWTTLKELDHWNFSLSIFPGEMIATEVDSISIRLYSSTDGGLNWTTDTLQIPEHSSFAYVSFGTPDSAWLYMDVEEKRKLLHTTNKGISWSEQLNDLRDFSIVRVVSSQELYILTGLNGCRLMKSSDGGANWVKMYDWPYEYSNALFTCEGPDKLMVSLFRYTDAGLLMENFTSSDGGSTWTSYKSPINHDYFNSQKYTSEGIWIAGCYGDLLFRENSGNWVPKFKKLTNYKLTGVSFTNGNTGYICNNHGSIFKSTDGKSFTEIYNSGNTFYDICSINNMIIAIKSNRVNSLIQRSIDGGTNWNFTTIDSLQTEKIYFRDENNGWITTSRYGIPNTHPVLLKTTDAGLNWTKVNCSELTGSNFYLHDITFVNDQEGWMIGNDGIIMMTSDGGQEWKLARGNLSDAFWDKINLYALKAFDENRLMLTGYFYSGNNYSYFKFSTTNKGITWDTTYLGKYFNYKTNIYFRNQTDGWILGNYVYKTNDGGITWNLINDLKDIEDYSAFGKWVWAVGDGGTVYKKTFTTVNVEGVKHTTGPTKFELYQNYPNPFNPTTNIRFDLNEKGNAVIKVFDILGKEIVNENLGLLEPGTYNYTFNGNSVAAGVYIYLLQIDSNLYSKKMLLLK